MQRHPLVTEILIPNKQLQHRRRMIAQCLRTANFIAIRTEVTMDGIL